jgi:hypothetical protein
MVRAGHAVDVFTYDDDLVVPPGVTVRAATEIFPYEKVVLHESGSWSLFADIFRYEALRRGAGIWVDLDVLVLRNLGEMGDHIFGWQDPYVINNAVLRLPADSDCLEQLISLSRAPVVVGPHWSLRQKAVQIGRSLFKVHVPIQNLEWGTVGPMALTHFVTSGRLLHHCQPMDVFYPVHFMDATSLFSADSASVEGKFTSSTRAVHLWNDKIKEAKRLPPPRGSFVAKMCEKFDVAVTDGGVVR